MEAMGYLVNLTSDQSDDTDERVFECKHNFKHFCRTIYGEVFDNYYLSTAGLCGEPEYELEAGVNVVTYDAVKTYMGEDNSLLGSQFVTFLGLLLFVWTMLMLDEIKQIINFVHAVMMIPKTDSDGEAFSAPSAEGKMEVASLPIQHKLFALLCIASTRFIIAVVIFMVGTFFLCLTDNLLDLVLNSTALGFLIEIDEMIHNAFLGKAFSHAVTDNCEVVSIPIVRSHFGRAIMSVFVVISVIVAAMFYEYNKRRGIGDTGHATECLCHIAGNCLATMLIRP